MEIVMTVQNIYEADIWDVMALPDDWNACIDLMDGDMIYHWQEDLPNEYNHLVSDMRFLSIAMDRIDVYFEYGPPLDESFILESLKNDPDITTYRVFRAIPLKWWYDRPHFVSKLVKNNYASYISSPKKLLKDKSYALNAASINGAILEFSPRVIRNDLEIATAALESNPFAIHFLTKATQSKMDASLIDHCLKIAKGDKKELYKIKDKKVISNIFVSLMNCGPSVQNSKSYFHAPEGNLRARTWYGPATTDPLFIDNDVILYAFSINPELISYIQISHLDRLCIRLIEMSSSNPFSQIKEIQSAQKILFDAYLDKTKDLDFVNPFAITGHARIMCDLV